eukprot:TRINITY_DN28778_c0_g1_i1.p1 TRINITY_DN28778_c0_g1~~TRINITY_DN28778_c0_g1_i1.p1  ORF type:complete len:167 (+),score=28.58 TRINITY_DN28778_c0_g1_i1:62-502(+)
MWAEKWSALMMEKAEVQSSQEEAHRLLAALSSLEKRWESYMNARSTTSTLQHHQTQQHLEKIAEYHSRLTTMQTRASATGLTPQLTHTSLLSLFDTYTETARSVAAKQRTVNKYKIPPNITQARARLAQLRAEVKELQSRPPKKRY